MRVGLLVWIIVILISISCVCFGVTSYSFSDKEYNSYKTNGDINSEVLVGDSVIFSFNSTVTSSGLINSQNNCNFSIDGTNFYRMNFRETGYIIILMFF